jgi:hypothetical protein
VGNSKLLVRQDVCEYERLNPSFGIPLTRYTDDARSATELVDGCEDLPKMGEGPVSGHARRLDLLK